MLPKSDHFLHWSDLFSRYNVQASRRDKWFRLAQYVSRFVVLHCTDVGLGKFELVARLKKLESACSDARKLYRIFGSIDFLQKAIDLYRKPGPDQTINCTSIIANLAKAMWLFQDHFLWIGKVGLFQVNTARLTRGGSWCWVVALICLIIRDLKSMTNIELQMIRLRSSQNQMLQPTDRVETMTLIREKEKEWRAAQMELLKDCLDLTLPLSTLGRVGPKLASACGIVSTLIGVKQEWLKLL